MVFMSAFWPLTKIQSSFSTNIQAVVRDQFGILSI